MKKLKVYEWGCFLWLSTTLINALSGEWLAAFCSFGGAWYAFLGYLEHQSAQRFCEIADKAIRALEGKS